MIRVIVTQSVNKQKIRLISLCLLGSALLGIGITTISQIIDESKLRLSPWYSITGLVIGFILMAIILFYRRLDLLSPWILYPLVYLTYYLIGSLNISTYRREVDVGMLFPVVYLGLLGFLGGVLLAKIIPISRKVVRPSKNLYLPGVWNAIIPFYLVGLLSIVLILLKNGIPLLGGVTRSGILLRATVSPTLESFARLIWISAAIYVITVYSQTHRFDKKSKLLMIVTPLLLLPLGYRGYIVIFAVVVLFALFHVRRPTLPCIFSILGLIAIASYLIWIVRYSVEGSLEISTMARFYHFPIDNSFLFYLYGIMREDISLTGEILSSVTHGSFLGGRLFVADLLTILPGKQQSGVGMMAQMLHGSGVAGLTVSIVGGLYFDFGTTGVAIGLLVIGFLCMASYRRMLHSRSVTSMVLYSIIMTESLHYLHRGVFSVNYIWDVLVALCICKVIEFKRMPNVEKAPSFKRTTS